MANNFFEPNCKSISNVIKFGIVDGPPNTDIIAKITEVDEQDWGAEIENKNRYLVAFHAVDRCKAL